MKKFSKLAEPKELDFIAIENDGNGGKQIHILGYTYYGDDWKCADVCFCIVPLAEFVKGVSESEDYIAELMGACKQYEKDCTEQEVCDIINKYYDGNEPAAWIDYDELTEEFPLGNYVCGDYTDEEYVKDMFGNDLFAANLNLYDYGLEVVVEVADGDDGYFKVGYRHIGKDDTEWYAENDFDYEVAQDIITCAAIAKKQGQMEQHRVWVVTHTSMSMGDYAANGHTSVKVYDTEDAALAQLQTWRNEELEYAKEEERDPEIYEDTPTEFRMGWCMDSEQLRIVVTEVQMNK